MMVNRNNVWGLSLGEPLNVVSPDTGRGGTDNVLPRPIIALSILTLS